MASFFIGVIGASILSAISLGGRDPYFAFILMLALTVFKTWRSLLSLLLGGCWFYFWKSAAIQKKCDDTFWYLCQSDILVEPGYLILSQGWLGGYIEGAKDYLLEACKAWDPLWGPWAQGLLGGRLDSKGTGLTEIYRKLGLIHVLVISGSHFTFLIHLGGALLGWPSRLLYACRAINFRVWFNLHIIEKSILWLFLVFYAMIVGFPPPCQRAFIMGLLASWWPYIRGALTSQKLVRLSAFLQALFFPQGFASVSNALSWSALAIIQRFSKKEFDAASIVRRELAMACLSMSYFGQFSPLSLFLNPILGPLWNGLLLLAIIGVFAGGGPWLNLILASFHEFLYSCGRIQDSLWKSDSLAFLVEGEAIARGLLWLLTLKWLLRVDSPATK